MALATKTVLVDRSSMDTRTLELKMVSKMRRMTLAARMVLVPLEVISRMQLESRF